MSFPGLPDNATLWNLVATEASPRCSAATEPHLFGVMPSFQALGLSTRIDRGSVFAVWDPESRSLIVMDEWWHVGKFDASAGQPRPQRKSRIIPAPVCEALSQSKSSRELLSTVYDAFKAHRRLWEDMGIVHGDVSSANMCIVREGGTTYGLLLDFDTRRG